MNNLIVKVWENFWTTLANCNVFHSLFSPLGWFAAVYCGKVWQSFFLYYQAEELCSSVFFLSFDGGRVWCTFICNRTYNLDSSLMFYKREQRVWNCWSVIRWSYFLMFFLTVCPCIFVNNVCLFLKWFSSGIFLYIFNKCLTVKWF